jgi:hypothetical protein
MTASAARRPGWVRLAAIDISLDQLRSHARPRLFEAAKTSPGHGECLCTTPPQPLVIRLRGGHYHLAGWPDQGGRHDTRCPFFKLAPAVTGRSGYAVGAIAETADGTHIRLHQPLTVRGGEDTRPGGDEAEPAEALSRNTVSLLGLLHWLWEQAGLNRWDHQGEPRGWPHVSAALTQALTGSTVNGQPLDSCLYVPVPFTPDGRDYANAVLDRFVSALGARRAGSRWRGLILAEVRGISPTPYGEAIMLRHAKTPVFASAEVMDRARRAYRPAFAGSQPGRSRQIVLLLVDRTARRNLVAVDLCAMLTSHVYVPADSACEVQMADHLVARGRDFIKPCRYDDRDGVFPDFILTDAGPDPAFVEVWGVTGREEYEQRRRIKERHYRRAGALLVGWDVTTTRLADIALPPRA